MEVMKLLENVDGGPSEDGNIPEELGDRYIGCIKSKGKFRLLVFSKEVAEMFDGLDAVIDSRSNAPEELEVGEWVSFNIVSEDANGLPLAVNVEPAERPDGGNLPWE